MPRKEYKTITVKVDAFQQFARTIKKAKQDDSSVDNSTFLVSLLNKNHKGKKNRS